MARPVRRSFDRGRAQGPLHLVSTWASERGLTLGQRVVDGPSNEITAIPERLDALDGNGGIVTLDAMGCPKEIAARILASRADYLLALKANQGTAFVAVQERIEPGCLAQGATVRPFFDAFDDGHGRLVRRRVFVCPNATAREALQAWPGLRTALAIATIRSINGSGRTKTEVRYFLSSCPNDPAVLVTAIRRHRSIENTLHWVLDVTFREDDSRVRDRTAARNLALLRKIAVNLVAADRGSRTSVRGRRKKAAWNDAYMHRLIFG